MGSGLAVALAIAFACAGCSKPEEPIRAAQDPSAVTTSAAPATSSAKPATSASKLRVVKPPPDAELASFLRTERLRAKGESRVLVVYAGAKWCDPCKHFHALLDSGRLDATLSRTTLVELDVDQDTERLSAAGYKYRFVPYFAVAGADGHPEKEMQVTGKDIGDDTIEQLVAWQDAPR
jgi:thiol-disulfide isomerase/thioredoxin